MKKKKIWKRNYLLFGLGLGLIITSVISTTFLNKNNSILKNQNQLATNNNIDNSINLFSTEDDIRNFVHAKFEEIQKQIDLNNRKTYARHAVEPINSYLNDFFIKNEFTVNKLRSYVDDYSGTLSLAYSVSKQNFTLSEEYNFYNFCIRETYKQIGEKLDKKLNEIQEQISLNGNSVYASDAKEPLELFIRDFINNQNNNWVLQNLPITIDDSKGKITFDFAIFKKGANNDDLTYWGTRTFTGFKIKSTQNDILNQISAKFIEIQNKITLQGNLVFASEAKNSIETAIKSFFEKNNLQIKLFEIIDDDFNGSIKIDYQVSDGKIVAEGSIKFIGFKVKQNGEEIKDLISAKFIEIQNQITLQAKSHLPSQAKSSVETTIRNFFEENNLGVESLVITDDDSKGSLEVTYKVFEKIAKNTTYIEGSIIFEGFISNGLNEQAIKTEILNKFSEIQTQINSETNSIFASDAKTTIETTVKQFFVDNNFEIQILVIEIDDAKGILKINYRVSKNNILVENVQDLNGFAINN
ncbi:lipoprotein 17-related variable surface protein, partial [Mycoplasmoides pirum]|uniref:lipoprotein 17-related variable surface protein n=2 Tax=Mycoplasmoides pirum TaxID=2122 RepID=UPI0012DBCCE1